MAVARFAFGQPAANTATLLYTVIRTSLTSIASVNIGGNTKVSAWIVPSGEDANPQNWLYYINEVPLSSRETFETFKIAANVGDKIYVKSISGEVSFFINGIYDTTGTTDITVGAQGPESPQIGSIWINDDLDPQETFYWNGSEWNNAGTEGPTGPANTLTIGTVTDGDSNTTAAVSITGPTPDQILNITLRQGPTGPQGTFDIFADAPTGPDEGDVWFNSSDGRFYVYYDSFWVEALSNEAGPTGPRGPAGLPGADGIDGIDGVNPTISVTGPITITGPTGAPVIGITVGSGGVQGYDADLNSIAALSNPAGPSFLKKAADGSWSVDTTTYAPLSGATFSGTVTAPAFTSTGAVSARTFSGSVASTTTALDFATETFKTISIAAATTFTASNYSAGRTVTVRVTSDATLRALTFPTGWVFVGTKPTSIAASKTGILTITSFGTTEANCVAAWAVQA